MNYFLPSSSNSGVYSLLDTLVGDSTPIPCLNDGQQFDGPAVRIPSYMPLGMYGPSQQAIEFFGHFCGFACARCYLKMHPDANLCVSLAMLESLEQLWVEKGWLSKEEIGRTAPDPCTLHYKIYDIDSYRRGCLPDGRRINMTRRRDLHEHIIVDERASQFRLQSIFPSFNESTITGLQRNTNPPGVKALKNDVLTVPTPENRDDAACKQSYFGKYVENYKKSKGLQTPISSLTYPLS